MRNVPKMSKFEPVRKKDTLRKMQCLGLKWCKLDTFQTKLLLSDKEDIVDAITDLVNSSFEQDHFPKIWKYTIIKPLIKKVNGEIVKTNLRPVSNLKHLSKILECAALFQIMKHCEDNCLLPDAQSAYILGYSCETILIKLADKILNGMEMKQLSMIIAMDLSAAFDAVNHKILLKTFQNHYGICDSVLDWISSYLFPRWCSVIIDNHCSDLKQLDVSVPQGLCAGAYFFIMYATTLFTEISYDGSAERFGFADNHILYDAFSADSRSEEVETTLNLEHTLTDVKGWMNLVKLKMNTEKTEFIIFGHSKQLETCVTQQINVVGDMIDRSSCICYLGAFLDENLTLKEQVKMRLATSIRNFYKIKIRKFLTAQATETLVLGLVISHLDYGNSLLIGCQQRTLDIYQKVQNMCAKLVLQRNKYERAKQSLITLHWLPIRARIDYKLLCIAYNC